MPPASRRRCEQPQRRILGTEGEGEGATARAKEVGLAVAPMKASSNEGVFAHATKKETKCPRHMEIRVINELGKNCADLVKPYTAYRHLAV